MLVKFKEINGHCCVPVSAKIGDFNLGIWVTTQRKAKAKMGSQRKKKLDDIGFIWDARNIKT